MKAGDGDAGMRAGAGGHLRAKKRSQTAASGAEINSYAAQVSVTRISPR